MKINEKYDILTPTGFQDFSGIRSLVSESYLYICLSNGNMIKSSINHPFVSGGMVVLASDLSVGQYIDSVTESICVISIEKIEDSVELFDIVNVSGGNLFLTEGIVSHNCDFLASGHTVVEGEVLSWYLENTKEPLEKRGMTLDYWIWAYPIYTKNYVVFADVGRGDGNDNSSFQVVDVETLEQVAEYDGQMGTREFGNFLVAVATEWNNALLCINNRNVGWDVVQQAIERMYDNLYYSYRNDPYLDPNIHIRKNLDLRDKSDKVPGFTETAPIRNVAVSKLVTYLSEKSVKINSKRLINQLFVFIWYNGKAQAANGYHDDLVIAYMYELFMHDIALKLRSVGIEMTKKALGGTFKTIHKPTNRVPSEWQQQIGNKSESLTWLL